MDALIDCLPGERSADCGTCGLCSDGDKGADCELVIEGTSSAPGASFLLPWWSEKATFEAGALKRSAVQNGPLSLPAAKLMTRCGLLNACWRSASAGAYRGDRPKRLPDSPCPLRRWTAVQDPYRLLRTTSQTARSTSEFLERDHTYLPKQELSCEGCCRSSGRACPQRV